MLRASRGKSGKNGKSIKNRALSVEQLEARQVMAMDVGMNLEWIADYSPAWVFKDAFQQARAWQTQEYNTATRLSTNTSRPAHVDDKGWPTQLDTWTNDQGQVIQQRLLAMMFNGAGGVHPAGVYHLEWKGTGTISFLGDGRVLSRTVDSAGTTHVELDVTPTTGGIALRIDTMSSTDPIRDLHVWLPDYNGESFAGQAWRPGADFSPFHPLFIERLAPFESLRFTQMSSAVPSDIVHWSDSRPVDHARQSTFAVDFQNGVSPEYMIELSNELGANPWFNMPHLAQDDYVRRFAELVRDQLDPHLKVYVEWSNEVWNYAPGFEGHVWARDQAAAEGVRIEEIVARETRRDFAIWSEVFAGQEDRLIRTVGGFTAGVGTAGWNEQVLSRMQGEFDALAIAPYISPSRDVRATYTASTTVDQVLADTRANMAPVMTQVRMDADTVRRYESLLGRDLQLLAYEGGTHLDDGNRPYERAFFEANVDPRMHDLMLDYFRELEGAGLDSYMHFKFTDRHVTQLVNDDFGTLSRMDQPLETAPRYTALLDFIAE
ncbi:MAG TPA: hypothetical protein PLV92_11755, partial [Pirellulaceae bacterium]|nr:hypothetical protein [Pirellulaceae bacterium]